MKDGKTLAEIFANEDEAIAERVAERLNPTPVLKIDPERIQITRLDTIFGLGVLRPEHAVKISG